MSKHLRFGWAAVIAAALTGCTTGQLNRTPPLHFTPTNAVLQFTVGTVNFAGTGVGLNVLETDRAPSGYTAFPDNTVTLTGPAGFAGTPGSADPGAGAASVPLGAAVNSFPLGANVTMLAAADGFGIGPPGSSSSAISPFPAQPQFLDALPNSTFTAQRGIYGGPPAYPAPSGPPGYPEGFYLLALPAVPPLGAYTLTVSYSQNGTAATQTANATLSSAALLPVLTTPTYVSDGAGGGSGTVTLPPGVVEVLVDITDRTSGVRATAEVTGAGTTQTYTIPDTLGFAAGDTLRIQAFGFDYNDFELGPPTNLSQTPALPAQADVTVAPQGAAAESIGRHPFGVIRHR